MFGKELGVFHEPKCYWMSEKLMPHIPVCRDELRSKYQRIEKWRGQDYEYERISILECSECKYDGR